MWLLNWVARTAKYFFAKALWEKMKYDLQKGKIQMTEELNQKWIHLQGQVLTRGQLKWRWEKIMLK